MKYLLDSHILIWALTDYEELPEKVIEIISDERNEIYYSLASLREVTIKHINKPDYIPISGSDMSYGCRRLGYSFLSIQEKHVNDLENLKRRNGSPKHADPFDRILICQARVENMFFVTHDGMLQYYDEPCIMAV